MAELKFLKNLKKNHKLVPYLEELIADPSMIEEFVFEYSAKVSDDAFHPSGDCTTSIEDLHHKIMGTGEVRDWSGMEKTFMVGHFWHAYLQHLLVQGGLASSETIEHNHKMRWGQRPYEWATGSADVSSCQIPEEGDYLVDFKTMSSFQYKSSGVPDWAALKYEAQISVYMDWFGLDRALIVAINKDGAHDLKEFEYEANPDMASAIFTKWELAGRVAYEGLKLLDDEEEILDLAQYSKGPIQQ